MAICSHTWHSFSLYLIFLILVITIISIINDNTGSTKRGSSFAYALNSSLDDFNFAAVGDWSCTGDGENTLYNIIDKNPELVLAVGDLGYELTDCWFELIDPIDDKMKIAIGNHDHLDYITSTEYLPNPELLKRYMNYFNLTRQFYSFNYQNVHFVSMSSEVPYDRGSPQYNFVNSDLKKASANSSIDWIVVFYHRVAYTSPALIHSIAALRDTYHPLFEKYGVDLVIQAHSHNYQRSYPIRYNLDDPLKPIITDNNITNYRNPDGQIFTIVGTGGAPDIHNFTGQRPYMAAQFNAFGFLNIDVLENGTKLEGSFYANNGTVKDSFTIVKTKKENEEVRIPLSSNSTWSPSEPTLRNGNDDKFRIESVAEGFNSPTDIAFLDLNDILVLEKRNGTVKRVVNGQVLERPLLDVNVANKVERGMLGAAVLRPDNDTTHVYLYYTESEYDGKDICPRADKCNSETEPLGNRLYRYELTSDRTGLIKPKLILDLPASPGPSHNGGKMVVDADNNIYIIIGDVMQSNNSIQNFENGKKPDGTGGILKISSDGKLSKKGSLGNSFPLNLYYAYGIRNGFGLDIDPVTGNLWDTENGPSFGDEINLVEPGFNSGWKDVQGIWNHKNGKIEGGPLNLDGLVEYDGKGSYSSPEFTWKESVGPTGIIFFNSDKMGTEYRNSIFVGEVHDGNIYHFGLNEDRTALLLNGTLQDKVADTSQELENIIFAGGFGGISDLEVGPDGYLYVLSIGKGEIYRIVPK